MRAKVTSEGVLVPKEWFGNTNEVEILAEGGRVILVALTDPIFKLSTRLVRTGVKDGSETLDEHLYS
jgi:virulence-associated protein VagC